jgi:predicted small secreted protein
MRRLVVLVLAVSLLLAGCGGGSGGEDATSSSTTSTSAGGTPTTGGLRALEPDQIDRRKSPYCATWADIRSLAQPKTVGLDEGSATRRKKAYYLKLSPLYEHLRDDAPEARKTDVGLVLGAVKEAGLTGRFEQLAARNVIDAGRNLATYASESCKK